MKPIRVLLVDDHRIVRQGLHSILDPDERFEVVGEAATGAEALTQVQSLTPDIVVLDLKLTDMAGPDLCQQIIKISPNTSVIILTAYFQHAMVCACLQAGAKGYLIKDAEQLNLPEQLIRVAEGHSALDPRAADALTNFIQNPKDTMDALSAREVEVVRLIGQGWSNREIAAQLHITENTVKGYVKDVFAKLDAHNRVEAVMQAMQRGII